MAEHLTPLDATFLELEEADEKTLYSFGSALREVHPLVPLATSHAVGVALVSYDGEVFFGIVADPDSVPDLDVMLGAMDSSLGELVDTVRGRQVRTGSRKRRGPARGVVGSV